MKFLRAIHSLPYATPDRRIITRLGWDPVTQVHLHLPAEYTPSVVLTPTDEQVRQALVVMMAPWLGFRWATPDDAAGMIAGVLMAVFRPALNLCPGWLADASQQGSGKTLSCTSLGNLMTGQRVGVTPCSGDGSGSDDEMRKRLLSSAMSKDGFMCLDNVVGHFSSAALAGFLTSGRVVDRVLGSSRVVDAEAVILVTASSNQASLSADLLRRIVRCRIDAGTAPTARRFAFSPPEAALRDRLKIAEAACTLLAGYWAAGAPRLASDDAGGYVQWSDLCRHPVLWAESRGLCSGLGWGAVGDPAASLLVDSAALDPEIASLGDLLRSLNALSGGEGSGFTAKQVAGWFTEGAGFPSTDDGAHRTLYEALKDILGHRVANSEPSARTLGITLRNRRERVVGGLKLLCGTAKGSSNSWRIVHA